MACARRSNRVARLARRLGIAGLSNLGGTVSSRSDQTVLRTGAAKSGRFKKKVTCPMDKSRLTEKPAGAQVSLFAQSPPQTLKRVTRGTESGLAGPALNLTDVFSPAELQTLSVQLHLGEAAAARQIRELNSQVSRGPGHSDPRPLDWAQADHRHYRFLVKQLAAVRQGQDEVDLSSLSQTDRAELWEFTRFEADRALRNIDHLQAGLSHLKGATAAYLTTRHRLEARFYTHLATRLERMIPPEEIEARKAWD